MPRVAYRGLIRDYRKRTEPASPPFWPLVRKPALPDRRALAEHLKGVGRGGRRWLRLEACVAQQPLQRPSGKQHEMPRRIQAEPVGSEAAKSQSLQVGRGFPDQATGAQQQVNAPEVLGLIVQVLYYVT